ncbi:alpha/beta fold hydrolase [Hymenobacter algoricola]|uniref:alpha/beta fold hydrolase n=1 Tax=Hymenobacter algoricola TaxID=486267 RepID=UPI003CD09DD4
MWPPVLYLIPGLGADERVFRDLLPRLRGETHVMPWLTPAPAETLPGYAARVAEGIAPGQPCFVVGVSFGGVVALEIGRLRPHATVVLVSGIPTAGALPPLLRLMRASGVYRRGAAPAAQAAAPRRPVVFRDKKRRRLPAVQADSAGYRPRLRPLGYLPAPALGQPRHRRRHSDSRHPRPGAAPGRRARRLPDSGRHPLHDSEPGGGNQPDSQRAGGGRIAAARLGS